MKWTDYATRKDFENRDPHQKRNGTERTGTLISDAPSPGCQWVLTEDRKYACVRTRSGESYRIVSERKAGGTDV
jgi:hypothetical protein